MLPRQFCLIVSTKKITRQTKPKKGQIMNFSQGHSGTKVRDVNRACFPREKHQNSQKWAKFMNISFWPFLWFGLPGRLLTQKSFGPGGPKKIETMPSNCRCQYEV